MTQENKAATALAHRIVAGAVANAGPHDDARDIIELLVSRNIDVDGEGNIKIIDENGGHRISMRPGYPSMTLEEYMDEIKASRPTLFRNPGGASASTGSGGPHTDPGNPFSRAGWNVTAQMQVMRSDPARAAKLQAEAGR